MENNNRMKSADWFDITKPEYAYIYGFIQTDGHLGEQSRNRGRISISISIRDLNLLEKISKLIPANNQIHIRTCNTNFKDNYTSACWSCHDWGFREKLKEIGLPVGKKSETIFVPTCNFSIHDYYRGLIDGDGSLGLTGANRPFISFTTSSDNICENFLEYLKKYYNITRTAIRNKRDNIYNIMAGGEQAKLVASSLYYKDCLAIDRKIAKSKEMILWAPKTEYVKGEYKIKRWTEEEDKIVLKSSAEDAMKNLNRTERSVKMRRFRLLNNFKY